VRKFYLFKIFGIPVEIDYSWFIIFLLLAWSLSIGYFPQRFPNWTKLIDWLAGIFSSLMLFVSVLLHELAHSIVAKRNGIPIAGITLFIFGGVSQMTKEPDNASSELKMALAGPAMSFVLGFVFLAVALLVPLRPVRIVFGYLGFVNGILGLFNLIPGFPLDGGRVLRAILWKQTGNIETATRIASQVGQWIAIFLMAFGFYQILRGLFINGIWFILIGLFLRQAAGTSLRQLVFRRSLAGVKVREIMEPDVVTVSPTLPLDRLVDDCFFKYHYDSFPVVDAGDIVGLVTLAEVKGVEKRNWQKTTVGQVMTPIGEVQVLEPEEEAVEALNQMVKDGTSRFPVVVGTRLVGILTRRDITELLRIKTDLGK